MNRHKLIIEVSGGVLVGVYSDWLDSLDIEVVIRDFDNINAGDIDPIPDFNIKKYHILYE